jgi:NADPH-dependent 2,4-dienoyl-CoA reductase/sulfur reductase-like enzyme
LRKQGRPRPERDGRKEPFRYDRLIFATGASPIRPAVPASALEASSFSIPDSFAVQRWLAEREVKSAALVGAGYIGLEMADALTQPGVYVTLLNRSETVQPTIDPALGRIVRQELQANGVRALSGVSAVGIERSRGRTRSRLCVADSAGGRHDADLVIFAVGGRPNSGLAERTGARLGTNGAVAVTRYMRANVTDIVAAGDCVETLSAPFSSPWDPTQMAAQS